MRIQILGKRGTLAAVGLFCLLAAPELRAQLSFKTYRNVSSRGDASVSGVVADFNNDEILDLAIANTFSSDVSILLGDGRGGFLPPVLYPAGGGAFFVSVGDFNNDGNLDLAVANFAEPVVSVLLGDGMGRFRPPRNFPVHRENTGVTVADFNNDGILDLATANFGALPPEGQNPDCAGSRDVAHTITILYGEPAGDDVQFGRRQDIRTGCAPEGVYAADLNRDDYPDLVVTNFFENNFAVLINRAGEFPTVPTLYTSNILTPAYGALGDFNEDGRLDFASANWASHNVSVLLANDQGGFQTPIRNFTTQGPPAAGLFPRVAVVGDFDSDGHLDMATSNFMTNDVSLLFGDGQGGFSAPKIVPLEGRDTWFMTGGDFNNDGQIDLAVIRQDGAQTDNISILTGDGAGNFGNFSSVRGTPVALAAEDFNRDNKPDLAIANVDTHDVLVRLGDGKGGFSYEERLPVGERPVAVAAGDLNNDSRADLVTANFASDTVTVWWADAQGRLSTRQDISVGGSLPNFVVIADFNRDGRMDLATANFGSNNVSVLFADPRGGFLPARTFPIGGTGPWSIGVGDFDSDQYLDLVTANSGSNDISVLLNDRNGGFAAPRRAAVGMFPRSLVVSDYNGDGKLDLAVVNTNSSDVTVLYGEGNGAFSSTRQTVSLGAGAAGVYIGQADLDGDGRIDLVVADFGRNQVHILRGDVQTRGRFLSPVSYPAGVGPHSIAIGDYNGDGKKDLALVDLTSQNLAILLNTSQP